MKQNLIVKSNVLLQQPLYKNSVELKIFSMVLLKIRDNPEGETFTLNIKELINHFDGSKENYTYLKSVAKKMFGAIDLNPLEKGFDLNVIFIRINTKEENEITFEINKNIKPYILNLTTNFTKYYFENIARLKSGFSIRIYELLKQYEKIGYRKETIEYIKHFLNINDTKYKLYNDLKRFAILVAQAELKEKTDIYFEFEEIKKGRKVYEIKFLIFKNNNGSSKKEDKELSETKLTQEQILLNEKLINTYKISKKIADDLILAVSVEQIEKNITYAENEYKKGIITKNFSGYLLEAIKNNYAGNISLFELEEKSKKQQEKKKAELDSKREALKSKLSKSFGIQERKKFIESLTEEQEKQVINDILKEVELDAYTTGLVKKKGLNTPAIYLFLNKMIEGFAENREVFIAEGLKKAGL